MRTLLRSFPRSLSLGLLSAVVAGPAFAQEAEHGAAAGGGGGCSIRTRG
jgi:hypothetical protein